MSQRKLGTILSYIHIILTNTISLIYTPYMLRMLGQSEYGLYGTANSFISYLSILSFGVGGAYIRFNSQYRAKNDVEGERRLNGMFLTIFSVLSLIVLVGGVFITVFVKYLVKNTFTETEIFRLRVIMILVTLNMMVTFIFNVVMMALQAYEKFVVIRTVLLIMGIATPIINVMALKAGGKAVAISICSVITSVLSYVIFLIYAKCSIGLKFSFAGFRKTELKELFVFSFFLFLNTITDQITFATDNVVLSSLKGPIAVAIYTVGASFKGYFLNFSSSISSVFSAHVNMLIANECEKKQLDDLFQRVGRIQFYLVSLILIGYIFVGEKFIRFWAGENYSDAYWIGLLLILAVFIPSFQNIGIEIQKAYNKHKARSIVYFIISIVNVIITIPMSRKWSGIGAAAATTICMFVGTVLFMNWHYWKYLELDIKGFWKTIIQILPGFLPVIMICIGMNSVLCIDSLRMVLFESMVIVLVYICSVWFLSMNDYEKKLISTPVKKMLNVIKR